MRNANCTFDLSGLSALVTGGSRGIGFSIARALGRHGALVTITGRRSESLRDAVETLTSEGITARSVVCHQGDPVAVAGLFEHFDEIRRPPDIVVINAATNPTLAPLANVDLDSWQKVLAVNLTGSLMTAQMAARRMASSAGGSIIFIASVAGIDPIPGLGAYSVSKAGLLGMMRAFASELGPKNIRVNAIAPGLIETQFSAALMADPAAYSAYVARAYLGRHGKVSDIEGAALFLASESASFMTGQTLVVDGGYRV